MRRKNIDKNMHNIKKEKNKYKFQLHNKRKITIKRQNFDQKTHKNR